jgi:hypothetical protein
VFENGAEENIWTYERGSNRKKGWRKVHNVNSKRNNVWVIKSRRARWKAHVARMGKDEKLMQNVSRKQLKGK